jgi:polyisoprenoid-binding protein YceI
MSPRHFLATAVLLTLSAAANAAPVDYTIDSTHTDVRVSWDYLGFARPSARLQASGHVVYDAAEPDASSVKVVLPVASFDGQVDRLNQRVQREDYLDGAAHPEATFVSTAVHRTGDGHLRVDGQLTLRGVTKPVVLEAVVNKAGVHPAKNVPALGVAASTRIRRSDFGLVQQLPNIGDELEIRIELVALAEAGA